MLFKRKIYDKLTDWKISLGGEELVNVNIKFTKNDYLIFTNYGKS